jgi:hypothetical protein
VEALIMFENLFKKEKVTLCRYKPVFITIDNKIHEGKTSDWVIVQKVRTPVPDYLMLDVKEDGYIKDELGDMYILSNIICITWKKAEQKKVEDTFREFQIRVKAN